MHVSRCEGADIALCMRAGRIAALTGQADALLGRLFWLLARLREPESSVRLLQAVSVVVEVQCSFALMPIPNERVACYMLVVADAHPGALGAGQRQ